MRGRKKIILVQTLSPWANAPSAFLQPEDAHLPMRICPAETQRNTHLAEIFYEARLTDTPMQGKQQTRANTHRELPAPLSSRSLVDPPSPKYKHSRQKSGLIVSNSLTLSKQSTRQTGASLSSSRSSITTEKENKKQKTPRSTTQPKLIKYSIKPVRG